MKKSEIVNSIINSPYLNQGYDRGYDKGRADERAELLDKVPKVVKNRIDAYNPSYTDIYNVITELSDVVLNAIEEMKAEVEK